MNARWYEADEGKVHQALMPYICEVDRRQSDAFERFARIELLYDPHSPLARDMFDGFTAGSGDKAILSENVVASNVDAAHAMIVASPGIDAKFMTDGARWEEKRLVRRLGTYINALAKKLDVQQICQDAFKQCAKVGTWFVKVAVDGFDQIRVEEVAASDLIVDDRETRNGRPRQMAQRVIVDADELAARFPEFEDEIERMRSMRASSLAPGGMWADYREVGNDQLVVVEAWRLPLGVKGKKGYKPGKHVIAIEGADLLDEPYHKDHFPFARFLWSKRHGSYYGIGIGERIAGAQRVINKCNWQEDRSIDQFAAPTTWVRPADAAIAVKTVNRFGTLGVYKDTIPQTVMPPAVSPEIRNRKAEAKESSFEEIGQSRLAASAKKPVGIDSGVGLREYRDATSTRFAYPEKNYEAGVLQVYLLVLEACKDLGESAPVVVGRGKEIDWPSVDPCDLKIQIQAASDLSKNVSGRKQFALDLAQLGGITTDELRSLLDHPDLEGALSLYTSAMESADWQIEDILDGGDASPSEYQNLSMNIWRGTQRLLEAERDGAPDEVLTRLEIWINQSAAIQKMVQRAVNQNMAQAPAMPVEAQMPAQTFDGGMAAGPALGAPIAA